MSKLRLEISMSVDGYVTASGVRPEEPMGDGGQQLHEWAFGDDERGREVLAESQRSAGASIAGRRTYDLSIPWWGADGPGSSARTPTFIVSHSTPPEVPEGGVYTFVQSPGEALTRAAAAAGGKDVDVFSASIGQQLLRAGLVDEVRIHLVPVLLGVGTRLFENIGSDQIQLEVLDVIEGQRQRTCDTPSSGINTHRPGRPGPAGWHAQALTVTRDAPPHKIFTSGHWPEEKAHEQPRPAGDRRRPEGGAA